MMNSVKVLLCTVCVLAISNTLYAQTNTFPTTGNVGIGTLTPVYTLDINGVIRTNQSFYGLFNDQEYVLRTFNDSATGDPEQFFIKHNLGNVDIDNLRGDINFLTDVDITGSLDLQNTLKITRNTTFNHIRVQGSTAAPFADWRIGLVNDGGGIHSGFGFRDAQAPGDPVPFWIRAASPGNSIVVTPNGVGLGTTNPTEKLHVNGRIKAIDEVLAKAFTIEQNIGGGTGVILKADGGQQNLPFIRWEDNNGVKLGGMRGHSDGGISFGTGFFNEVMKMKTSGLDVTGTVGISGNTELGGTLMTTTASSLGTGFQPIGGGSTNGQFLVNTGGNRSIHLFGANTTTDTINGIVLDVGITNSGGGEFEMRRSGTAFLNYNGTVNLLKNTTINGNLGIGTASPAHKLDVNGQIRATLNGGNAQIKLERTGNAAGHGWIGANVNDVFIAQDASFAQLFRVTQAGDAHVNADLYVADQFIHAGDVNTYMQFNEEDQWRVVTGGTSRFAINNSIAQFYNPTTIHGGLTLDLDGNDKKMRFLRSDGGANNYSIEHDASRIYFYNETTQEFPLVMTNDSKVGIGTTNPDAKLAVKGDIHAEEVIVDLTVPGPDYVFEEDYDLTSLKDIEAYIKANKRLPEIPSAKEMEEQGIDLGVMNMLLLKKIEELTLHTIAQEGKLVSEKEVNKKQKSRLDQQEKLIHELLKRIEKLEDKED